MDHLELRKIWNCQKHRYQKTHTPQCRRCGYFSPWMPGCGLEIHHIKALVDGGNNDEMNLIVLCRTCHDEWHRQYEPQGIEFERFMQTPPLYVMGLIMNNEVPFTMDDVFHHWGNIKDYLTLHQPSKNQDCIEYVKNNSEKWIDW